MNRRLLTAGRGGRLTAPDLVFTALSEGGYTVIPFPKAYYAAGKTFIGWTHNGAIKAGGWDHAAEAALTATTLFTGSEDTHIAPALLARSGDGRIVAAYAEIQGASTIKVRISTNPNDPSSFGSVITAATAAPGTSFTYVGMVQLRGVVNDPIYLFYGLNPSSLGCVVSTDGGTTWGTKNTIITNTAGGDPHIYWQIGTDWDTRIDLFVTDNVPTESSLYHFYIDGTDGSSHHTDGTLITSFPFEASTLKVVLDNSNGACWAFGAAWDGQPACVIMQENGPMDNRVLVARLRSGAWQVDTVVPSVGGQFAGDKYFSGCGIAHDDPDTIYVAEKSTVFEMVRYRTSDDGASWTRRVLTSSSADDNVLPDTPAFAAPGLRAFWLNGDLTSATDYDFALRGYR